jgi:uncharacterized protein with NAD-binding domain and iron-sulfur cluster
MNENVNPKKKVIVLGGGPSALSSTYELTDYLGWDDKFEVTVYQMGWRLGGKTSTGRGIHNRIEEHGIHIFQGWYDNAFRMMKDAYHVQHEKNLAPQSPLQSWTDAFQPDYPTILAEYIPEEGGWQNWPIIFPDNDQEPGTAAPASMGGNIRKIIELVMQMLLGSPYQHGENPFFKWLQKDFVTDSTNAPTPEKPQHGLWHNFLHKIGTAIESFVQKEELKLLPDAYALAKLMDEKHGGDEPPPFQQIVELVHRFRCWFEKEFDVFLYEHNTMRRIFCLIEWMDVNFTGMLVDLYDEKTNSFVYARINEYDYCAWLSKHGGSEMMIRSAPVQFMYFGSFANLDGENMGQIAADVALRMVMLSINYKGSLVWKMRGGTGETLITPLYLVLKDRGVKFEFFHKVKNIHYSDTGEIEQITIAKQVRLKDQDKPYSPTFKVNGLDAWPSAPLYDQLLPEDAEKLQQLNIDLESAWSPWVDAETLVLKKGIDFDQIILGIPAAALRYICPEIMQENKRWKDMIEKVKMAPTFGASIWVSKSQEEMGMDPTKWGLAADMEPNTLTYANPLYSWTGMNLILKQENWNPDNLPKQLSYFCGTYPMPTIIPPFDDYGYPEREKEKLVGIVQQWLHDNMGWFWPKATSLVYPRGFDLNLLIDPDGADMPTNGIDRLEKQWFSLNIDPSNHFTLATPGSNKYRMKTNESDFSNLFLAGDWTDIGLNIGHMEGAFVSGLRAGQAVLTTYGYTDLKPILGTAELLQ